MKRGLNASSALLWGKEQGVSKGDGCWEAQLSPGLKVGSSGLSPWVSGLQKALPADGGP